MDAYLYVEIMNDQAGTIALHDANVCLVGAGTLIALGWKRGELPNLWTRGEPERVCTHMHMPLLPASPN